MSGIYTQGPGSGERDTTMRDLLAVVFKRKWLILGIFGLTSLSIGLKTVRSPVTFSSDATLLLNRQGARSSALERSGRALPWVEVVESEIEVLKSSPVLQRAQARLKTPTDTDPDGLHLGLGRIAKSVRAGVIGESNVIFVTGTARDAETAVRITNAVAESYVEYHRELFQLPDTAGIIQDRADSTFRNLESLQMERSKLLEQVGVTNIGDEERTLIDQRERLRHELADAERETSRLETEISDARSFLLEGQDSVPFVWNTGSVQGSSLMESLRKLKDKRVELTMLRQKFTERHPLIQEKQRDVETLRATVETALQSVLDTKEHDLRAEQGELRELRRQIADIDALLVRLPGIVQKLDVIGARIASLNNQYKELSNQAVDSEITKSSFRDYAVKILSPAVDASKNQKGDMVRLALGPILALMAGVGLAFYLENLDHSLGNREDVERHLEIPVLASFPDVELEEKSTEGVTKIPYQKGRRT